MTQAETRAMLARVDARQLRADAGIRLSTVARALGVAPSQVYAFEQRRSAPMSPAGLRWARFVAALERRAEVTAAISAGEAAGVTAALPPRHS